MADLPIRRERLRTKDLREVMVYLLDFQVASYEPLNGSQKVFLWLAQIINDELRMRSPPSQNAKLYAMLEKASKPWPWKPPPKRRRKP